MIYLLQSKHGLTRGVNTLAEAKAETRSGTFSISAYGFGKGSTTARWALRIGRDITLSRMVNVDSRPEFRCDPAHVKTAMELINAADALILCKVSKVDPEETQWELPGRVDGKAGKVGFVSKSLPEIKAAMRASREKGKITEGTS